MTLSLAQSYSGAEPSAARFRPGTAKCKRTIPGMFARQNGPTTATITSATGGGFFLAAQWGAADAEIKVPSDENTELKRSPFKAWSRSVYSHTCYAYCQGFLPC